MKERSDGARGIRISVRHSYRHRVLAIGRPNFLGPFAKCTKQFNELDSSISAAIHIFCWPFVRQYIASVSPAIVLLSFSLSHISWPPRANHIKIFSTENI
jgi:hypothetical protein